MQADCTPSDSSLAPATVGCTQSRLKHETKSYNNQQQAVKSLALHGAAATIIPDVHHPSGRDGGHVACLGQMSLDGT